MNEVDDVKYTRPSERSPSGWTDISALMKRRYISLGRSPSPYQVMITAKGMRARSFDWAFVRAVGEGREIFRNGKAKSIDEAMSAIDASWPDMLDDLAERRRRRAAYELRQADAFAAKAAELRQRNVSDL